jgi:hypothetical protein
VKGGAVDWEKGLMAKMQMMLSRVCATAWSLAKTFCLLDSSCLMMAFFGLILFV